jgi:hypothetical protein
MHRGMSFALRSFDPHSIFQKSGKIQSQIEATLVIFQLSREYPFPGKDPGLVLNLGWVEQDALCKIILQQGCWSINLDLHSYENCPGYFLENDRQILNDPEGLAMKAALARGRGILCYRLGLMVPEVKNALKSYL